MCLAARQAPARQAPPKKPMAMLHPPLAFITFATAYNFTSVTCERRSLVNTASYLVRQRRSLQIQFNAIDKFQVYIKEDAREHANTVESF